jgi:hypothetical protein
MLMKLPEQGGKLYFPVLQECESGKSVDPDSRRWPDHRT